MTRIASRYPGNRAGPARPQSDDDEAELRGTGPIARARARERARCAAIYQAGISAGRLELAKALAFNSAMPRREAIGALQFDGEQFAHLAETTSPSALATSWDRSMQATRPAGSGMSRTARPGDRR